MSDELAGHDFVCLAHLPWDGPWKAYHQLVSRMAEVHRVFCVDPPSSARQVISGGGQGRRAAIPPVLRRVSDDLLVYHPPWWLSRSRVRSIDAVVAPIRMRHARTVSRRHGFRAPILWAFEPTLAPFVHLFAPRFLIYHVVDDYVEYLPPEAAVRRRRMAAFHGTLLHRADVVFTVTAELQERCRQINPSTYLVPNGVDFERFQRAMADPRLPQDIRFIPRPIVGYVGVLEPKLDLDALRWVASARPDWSLVLVGPAYPAVREALAQLRGQYRNVHYLGGKQPEEVPYYVKSLDVAILADREQTSGDSIKLYEYLACGRPVVSFEALDEISIRNVRHLVRPAREREDFVRNIEAALNDPPGAAGGRIAFAREQTWQKRVEAVETIVAKHLAAHSTSPHPAKPGKDTRPRPTVTGQPGSYRGTG